MTFNILRYKGKSSETRFKELEEARKKKEIDDERARLEGKVANPAETNDSSNIEGGLAVASGVNLYVLDLVAKKARYVLQRADNIRALAVHDGKIYDAGEYHDVFDTLSNVAVAQRNFAACALAVHDGRLYDAGLYCKIFDTLSNRVVAERDKWILALAVHNGRLYDAGSYKKVFDTLSDRMVAQRNSDIYDLASLGGKLYDSEGNNKVFDILSNKQVAQRNKWIGKLAVHNGRLYDGGNDHAVFDTLNDPDGKNPVYSFGQMITAMCSLPKNLFDECWMRGRDT